MLSSWLANGISPVRRCVRALQASQLSAGMETSWTCNVVHFDHDVMMLATLADRDIVSMIGYIKAVSCLTMDLAELPLCYPCNLSKTHLCQWKDLASGSGLPTDVQADLH